MFYYGVHYYTSLLFKRYVLKDIIFGHSPFSLSRARPRSSPSPLTRFIYIFSLFLSLSLCPNINIMKLVEETVFAEESTHVTENDQRLHYIFYSLKAASCRSKHVCLSIAVFIVTPSRFEVHNRIGWCRVDVCYYTIPY